MIRPLNAYQAAYKALAWNPTYLKSECLECSIDTNNKKIFHITPPPHYTAVIVVSHNGAKEFGV